MNTYQKVLVIISLSSTSLLCAKDTWKKILEGVTINTTVHSVNRVTDKVFDEIEIRLCPSADQKNSLQVIESNKLTIKQQQETLARDIANRQKNILDDYSKRMDSLIEKASTIEKKAELIVQKEKTISDYAANQEKNINGKPTVLTEEDRKKIALIIAQQQSSQTNPEQTQAPREQ